MESLRQKTAAIRREHVLDAALRVFQERGFRGATIRDVAREAGVSDGTIYNIFDNKAALLDGLLAALAGEVGGGDRSPADDPPATLETLLAARWATFTPEVLALLRVVLAEALVDPELRAQLLERVIAPPIDALAQALGPGATLPARIVMASFLGLVMLQLLGEAEVERRRADIPSALADLLTNGMGSNVVGATASDASK